MSCSFGRSFLKAGHDQVPRRARAPNTSQQVSGIGGYAEAILQRLQGERTFSPSPGNSLFATAPHRLRLAFATLNARMTKWGSTGSRSGTARPFPLWRLLSCPHAPPVDPITREWYCPRPEYLAS